MKLSKKASLLTVALLIGGLAVGCKDSKVDVETVKQNSPIMLHEEVEKEIEVRDDMSEIYRENALKQILNSSEDSDTVKEYLATLTVSEQETFMKYANVQSFSMRMVASKENKEFIDNAILENIKTLLNHMYFLPEGYEEERVGLEKFKELSIEKTMFDYLTQNKITIKEISEITDIETDFSSLPFKATVTYILTGEVNGETFEEVITQDFYVSPEDSEVLEGIDPSQVNLDIDGIITK